MDNRHVQKILDKVKVYIRKLERLRETILATTVMVNEIPAPTFQESNRAHFLANRFSEMGMTSASVDEKNNALGIIPGQTGEQDILVAAHLDTFFDSVVDHTVTLHPNRALGPGISDNSLGVAVLGILPIILEHVGLRMNSNIVLLGSSRSLGGGDLEGLRFVLENYKNPFRAAVCLEGTRIGRLSFSSIAMLRGEISYRIPDLYDWTKLNSVGAIVDMNDIINHILEIPLPLKPKSNIVLGSIEAGSSYNTLPTRAILRFEIRSESDEIVDGLSRRIKFLVEEMTSKTGAMVRFQEIARRYSGGTDFSHPLNIIGREILKTVDVCPRISPSTSEVSALIDHGVPAVTIGLTVGENAGDIDESIEIEPISRGIAQFVALLEAIDSGCADQVATNGN